MGSSGEDRRELQTENTLEGHGHGSSLRWLMSLFWPGPAEQLQQTERTLPVIFLFFCQDTFPSPLPCPPPFWKGCSLASRWNLHRPLDGPPTAAHAQNKCILPCFREMPQEPLRCHPASPTGLGPGAEHITHAKGAELPAPGPWLLSPQSRRLPRCRRNHPCSPPHETERGDWPKVTSLGRNKTRPRIRVSRPPRLSATERHPAAGGNRPLPATFYYPLMIEVTSTNFQNSTKGIAIVFMGGRERREKETLYIIIFDIE